MSHAPRSPAEFRAFIDGQCRYEDRGHTSACKVWTGRCNSDGYAQAGWRGQTLRLHRPAYEFARGAIPTGMVIDHVCRVRNCLNPEHLEVVTNAENVRRGLLGALHTPVTHCKNGHEYTPENSYFWRGKRKCRGCSRDAVSRYAKAHPEYAQRQRDRANEYWAARRLAAKSAQAA